MLPDFDAWQIKVQGTYNAKRKNYLQPKTRFKRKGVSDIMAFGYGFAWFIEVKAPGKKKNTTEHQYRFLKAASDNCQQAFVADCLEDVEERVSQIRRVYREALALDQ